MHGTHSSVVKELTAKVGGLGFGSQWLARAYIFSPSMFLC